MAKVSNIYIDQGSDFYSRIELYEDNGDPLDLTGYTAQAQIRKYAGAKKAYNIDCSIEHPGVIVLYISPENSSEIPDGRYLYDVEITAPTGNVKRVIQGSAIIDPNITRA